MPGFIGQKSVKFVWTKIIKIVFGYVLTEYLKKTDKKTKKYLLYNPDRANAKQRPAAPSRDPIQNCVAVKIA